MDRTGDIATKYGAIFEFHTWEGHIGQKNAALRRCTQPWVLCLDADEALSPELARSIRQLFAKAQPNENGFWLNRRTYYLGDWIRHAWYPEWRVRLVRRNHAEWRGLDPHDKLEADGATARLDGDLLHYPPFAGVNDHLQSTIGHARTMARSYANAGRRCHWYHLLLSPWAALFKSYVFKQGWRDGWRGLMIACVTLIGTMAKYAFLLSNATRPFRTRPYQSENWCQGRELNSRPTPNAFGAALRLLQIIQCERGILLGLESALHSTCR